MNNYSRLTGKTTLRLIAIILILLIPAQGFVLAEKTQWTETETLKTKRIHDDAGNLIYEGNFDKNTGATVGPIFDKRPKNNPEDHLKAKVVGNKYIILKDSLIKIKMLTELDSRRTKKGDTFNFETANNVAFQGKTIIPSGSKGQGVVNKVTRRGKFGRNGLIESSFNYVTTPSGIKIHVALTKEAAEQNKRVGYAAGASMVGLALLGPIGLVGGVFVHGDDVNVPIGSVFFLGVEKDATVQQ